MECKLGAPVIGVAPPIAALSSRLFLEERRSDSSRCFRAVRMLMTHRMQIYFICKVTRRKKVNPGYCRWTDFGDNLNFQTQVPIHCWRKLHPIGSWKTVLEQFTRHDLIMWLTFCLVLNRQRIAVAFRWMNLLGLKSRQILKCHCEPHCSIVQVQVVIRGEFWIPSWLTLFLLLLITDGVLDFWSNLCSDSERETRFIPMP